MHKAPQRILVGISLVLAMLSSSAYGIAQAQSRSGDPHRSRPTPTITVDQVKLDTTRTAAAAAKCTKGRFTVARESACAKYTGTIRVIDPRTGRVIGKASATVTEQMTLRFDRRTWRHHISFRVDSGWGLATSGLVRYSLRGCGAACTVHGRSAPKPIALHRTTKFDFTLNSRGPALRVNREKTWGSWTCTACSGRWTRDTRVLVNQPVRCDSTQDQGNGCAYKNVVPEFKITRTGKAGESARLIYAAQRDAGRGHYGWRGHGPVLRRTKDQNWRRQNQLAARRICQQQTNPPPRSSCDEYPFASTREGNWRNPRAVAKMIDAGANELAGNWLNDFYRRNRVTVDGDAFWVFVP